MIPDNILSDRLNEFKRKKQASINSDTPKEIKRNIKKYFNIILLDLAIISNIILGILIRSFFYGYSLKIIFKTDWKFIDFMIIGISINFIFLFILNLIRITKNKDEEKN